MSNINFDKRKIQEVIKILSTHNISELDDSILTKEFALISVFVYPSLFKELVKFQNDKDVVLNSLNKKKVEHLEYMSDELKNDYDFIKTILKIKPTAISVFNTDLINKIPFSDITQAFLDSGLFPPQFSSYFYKNDKEAFFNLLSKLASNNALNVQTDNTDIVTQLPLNIQHDKEFLMYQLEQKKYTSISLMELPEELRTSLDIVIPFFNEYSDLNSFMRGLTNTLQTQIQDYDYFNEFNKRFTGIYSQNIVIWMMNNENFRENFSKILKAYPDEDDYRPFVRETLLLDKFNKHKDSSKNIEKTNIVRKKV